MFDDDPTLVEGEMTVSSGGKVNRGTPGEPDFNTLDEPIKETFVSKRKANIDDDPEDELAKNTFPSLQLRDVRAVGSKFKHVLYPKEKNSLLKEWDLWGPLVLCTFMATILQGESSGSPNDGGPEFAEVFVIVWIGAMVVTLNSKLLGGNM